jgi:hypothetical protein
MTTITRHEYRQMLQSAKQVKWAANLSVQMTLLCSKRPLLRLPLLLLSKALTAYARWHYCRANRIYARVTK